MKQGPYTCPERTSLYSVYRRECIECNIENHIYKKRQDRVERVEFDVMRREYIEFTKNLIWIVGYIGVKDKIQCNGLS